MPQINLYLFFNGNCAEAMKFYEKTLGGKLDMMKAGDTPDAAKMPPGSADKIIHARLVVGDAEFMASDWMAPAPFERVGGFRASLSYKDGAEAKRVFDALAEGGSVQMPFEKTFFSPGFGMLTDRFGTPWMVHTEGEHSA